MCMFLKGEVIERGKEILAKYDRESGPEYYIRLVSVICGALALDWN